MQLHLLLTCLLLLVLVHLSYAFNATNCPVCFRIMKACKTDLYPTNVVKKRSSMDLLKKYCSMTKSIYVEEVKFCYDLETFQHEISRLMSMNATENRICKKVYGLNPNFCAISAAASGFSTSGSTFKPTESAIADTDVLYQSQYEKVSNHNSSETEPSVGAADDDRNDKVTSPNAAESSLPARPVNEAGLFLPDKDEEIMCVLRTRHPRVFNFYYDFYECSILDSVVYSCSTGEVFKTNTTNLKKKKREVFNPDVIYE